MSREETGERQNNPHKRSNSKDNLKNVYGKVCYPLVNTSLLKFNKNPRKLMTDLKTVKDEDEGNSTSHCPSVAQNQLKDKVNKDGKFRMSRDFFREESEDDINLNVNEDFDFSKRTPIPNIMEPVLQNNKSEISALNLNESEFDFNAEANDVIENDGSFMDNPFYQEGDMNGSAILNKSGFSMNRTMTANPYLFNQPLENIEEDNECSSSQHQKSLEESKIKDHSKASKSKVKSSDSDNEEKASNPDNGEMKKLGDESPF